MSEHNWQVVGTFIESLDFLTLEQIRLVQRKIVEELNKDYRTQQIIDLEESN